MITVDLTLSEYLDLLAAISESIWSMDLRSRSGLSLSPDDEAIIARYEALGKKLTAAASHAE